jgi:hypothetical protein
MVTMMKDRKKQSGSRLLGWLGREGEKGDDEPTATTGKNNKATPHVNVTANRRQRWRRVQRCCCGCRWVLCTGREAAGTDESERQKKMRRGGDMCPRGTRAYFPSLAHALSAFALRSE